MTGFAKTREPRANILIGVLVFQVIKSRNQYFYRINLSSMFYPTKTDLPENNKLELSSVIAQDLSTEPVAMGVN